MNKIIRNNDYYRHQEQNKIHTECGVLIIIMLVTVAIVVGGIVYAFT